MESITIVPLEEKYLNKVAQIHRDGLSYTFNSRLGVRHLSFIYKVMAQDTYTFVGVALFHDQPVGVISGTLYPEKTKAVLLRTIGLQQCINIFVNFLTQPTLIAAWRKGNLIGREISYQGTIVQPILTAIAITSNFQGKGIGKLLVSTLEQFFKQKEVLYYRLDTLTTNSTANKFYVKLGFEVAEHREDSIIYIKRINYG